LLTAQAIAQALPPEVEAALARAKIPRDAVTLLVADVDGKVRRAWPTAPACRSTRRRS
jgi:D-alanyl-D-alanine carboxypeptidase/D-alanyl-D-alanine-endopeptidase (penicillin-binding protein 4)